jgi:hypothetical protein
VRPCFLTGFKLMPGGFLNRNRLWTWPPPTNQGAVAEERTLIAGDASQRSVGNLPVCANPIRSHRRSHCSVIAIFPVSGIWLLTIVVNEGYKYQTITWVGREARAPDPTENNPQFPDLLLARSAKVTRRRLRLKERREVISCRRSTLYFYTVMDLIFPFSTRAPFAGGTIYSISSRRLSL